MAEYLIDIIIPVWNRPVETRATLASFVSSSPEARLIIVNHGSERETESILNEFAEALDDRVVLAATERNIGTVAALNLGLQHAAAPYLLLASNATRLAAGWTEAVIGHFSCQEGAGAITLNIGNGGMVEADCGSFAALVLKKELLLAVAGFDESLDGSVWALRDFTRRAQRAGFLTYCCGCPQLRLETVPELGSRTNREERMRTAGRIYADRWGTPLNYLLFYDDVSTDFDSETFRDSLLQAARVGHRITVVAGRTSGRKLHLSGLETLHQNIGLKRLPLLFPGKAARAILDAACWNNNGTVLIDNGSAGDCVLARETFANFLTRSCS